MCSINCRCGDHISTAAIFHSIPTGYRWFVCNPLVPGIGMTIGLFCNQIFRLTTHVWGFILPSRVFPFLGHCPGSGLPDDTGLITLRPHQLHIYSTFCTIVPPQSSVISSRVILESFRCFWETYRHSPSSVNSTFFAFCLDAIWFRINAATTSSFSRISGERPAPLQAWENSAFVAAPSCIRSSSNRRRKPSEK